MGTYDRVERLPLTIEGYDLDAIELPLPHFTRVSTVFRLRGSGHEGVGEDVTYEEADQRAQLALGPALPLAGEWTLDAFSRHLDGLDLFPAGPPERSPSRQYRRWAIESAALDLALRQAGVSLADALGRVPVPVTFVVSMNLGSPATVEPVRRWLARDPGLRFKLDPDETWTPELAGALRDTGAVATIDLKGFYVGTPVDLDADPELYRMLATELPDAWIEDPNLNAQTRPVLSEHLDRLTWDAPLESLEDITGLKRVPRCINIKPSRFGSVRELLAAYDHCAATGIAAYGGGQFELGPGRGQIQYLASLFHPDTPNDVAPAGYNNPTPPDDLPGSPLTPAPSATGFRWGTP
jgi:L-alanine-DL-glutamate epimerase-like enolase superfamily enzyme